MGRARAFLLVTILLAGTVAGPMSAPAAADSTSLIQYDDSCSTGSKVVAAMTWGYVNQQCLVFDDGDSRDNITAQASYNTFVSISSNFDSHMTMLENTREESKVAAQMRAEIAIANAYENGSSQAYARSEAVAAVEEYYSKKEMNQIRYINATTNALRTNIVESQSSSTASIGPEPRNSWQGRWESWNDLNATRQYTLANGTTVTVADVNSAADGYNGEHFYTDKGRIRHVAPSGSSLPTAKMYPQRNNAFLSNQQSDAQGVIANVKNLSDNIYPELENGNLNATDIISRNNKVYNLGVDGGENRSYANSLATYSALGYSSPDLNGTGTITISYNGANYSGMIYTTSPPPNGTWEAGTTYNATTMNGTQFFVTTDAREVSLEGEFTIESIVDQTGASVGNVSTVDYRDNVVNATDFQQMNDRLDTLIAEYESRSADGGAGGGGLLGGGNNTLLLLGGLALAAALLAGKSQNGGGRRGRR